MYGSIVYELRDDRHCAPISHGRTRDWRHGNLILCLRCSFPMICDSSTGRKESPSNFLFRQEPSSHWLTLSLSLSNALSENKSTRIDGSYKSAHSRLSDGLVGTSTLVARLVSRINRAKYGALNAYDGLDTSFRMVHKKHKSGTTVPKILPSSRFGKICFSTKRTGGSSSFIHERL